MLMTEKESVMHSSSQPDRKNSESKRKGRVHNFTGKNREAFLTNIIRKCPGELSHLSELRSQYM